MLEDKVKQTIEKYKLLEKGDSIVIGVSGGPDSMSLLNTFNNLKNQYNIKIHVAHINHMIRKEAIEDEQYVLDFCAKNNIDCYVKRVDIINLAKQEKSGLEETGRNARYDFFDEILIKTKSSKIATAHTSNDTAETIIMNLLRGTGINGLKGIEAIRDNKFIRPLIEITRDEIEEYCQQEKLNPKRDITNEENTYTRNKIRNIVIPYIKQEFNPNIIQTLMRLANIVEEETKYFDKIILNVYNNIMLEETPNQIILKLSEFNELETVIKSRIILYTISKLIGSTQGIQKIHIEDIIKLCNNNVGNKRLSPQKQIKIIVKNKQIKFLTAN